MILRLIFLAMKRHGEETVAPRQRMKLSIWREQRQFSQNGREGEKQSVLRLTNVSFVAGGICPDRPDLVTNIICSYAKNIMMR